MHVLVGHANRLQEGLGSPLRWCGGGGGGVLRRSPIKSPETSSDNRTLKLEFTCPVLSFVGANSEEDISFVCQRLTSLGRHASLRGTPAQFAVSLGATGYSHTSLCLACVTSTNCPVTHDHFFALARPPLEISVMMSPGFVSLAACRLIHSIFALQVQKYDDL